MPADSGRVGLHERILQGISPRLGPEATECLLRMWRAQRAFGNSLLLAIAVMGASSVMHRVTVALAGLVCILASTAFLIRSQVWRLRFLRVAGEERLGTTVNRFRNLTML